MKNIYKQICTIKLLVKAWRKPGAYVIFLPNLSLWYFPNFLKMSQKEVVAGLIRILLQIQFGQATNLLGTYLVCLSEQEDFKLWASRP